MNTINSNENTTKISFFKIWTFAVLGFWIVPLIRFTAYSFFISKNDIPLAIIFDWENKFEFLFSTLSIVLAISGGIIGFYWKNKKEGNCRIISGILHFIVGMVLVAASLLALIYILLSFGYQIIM